MADVFNFGYPNGGPLAPDEEEGWIFGPYDASFEGTWNFAAHPNTGLGSQYPQGISVSFQQTFVNAIGQHYVRVRFKNTYSTPVNGFTIWLTQIQGSDG